MAFQDFAELSLRRRNEKAQKQRKIIITGVVVGILLLVLIVGGIFAFFYVRKHDNKSTSSSPPPSKDNNQHSKSDKAIKSLCSSASYPNKCLYALTNALKKDPNSNQPKDFINSAILAAQNELKRAFNKTSSFNFDNPKSKEAFEDCKVLMEDAMEELINSMGKVGNNTQIKLSSEAPDLNNWLSAVMSYTQTCIDGFPDGNLKNEIRKVLKASKEYTSNSLALVQESTKLLSTFQAGSARHLLSFDEEGFPNWMNQEDRRMLKVNNEKPKPSVTVAKDGSGNYNTINEALKAMPQKYDGRYVIYVKEGVYEETVIVTKKMINVTMYGEGSQKSIITGSKNFKDGTRTFQTATFVALGEGFIAQAMGFRNTAGAEKEQAVAARIQADRGIFANCRFEGYQDTLYTQTHRQFYKSCVISGTIDFIFGDAAAVFQNCMIVLRKPMDKQKNIVTAQGRIDKYETTGIVLQNCQIKPDKDLEPVKSQIKSYLGRPWKEYSRTIVMESIIEDVIDPQGWLPWNGNYGLNTLYYAEFNNTGPGAKTDARVNWPGYKKNIDQKEAAKFTVGSFLQGNYWLGGKGIPVRYNFNS